MDAAYFDNTVANGPDGLLSLTDVQVISWGSVTTLDCFAEALSLAETVGSVITTFIGNPVDILMLAQLKSGTGLATPLLGIDPAVPTQRTIFGVPHLQPRGDTGCVLGGPEGEGVHGAPR